MKAVCLITGVILALSARASAHHAFSTEYRADQPVELEGTVVSVEWRNPHTYLYLQIKNANGSTADWTFETAGPLGLARNGWTRDSLRAGDQVVVSGYRSRSGLRIASARSVILKNGRKLSAGSLYDGGPKENGSTNGI